MSHEEPRRERRELKADYQRRLKRLGRLLQQAREQAKLTQTTVALMLGTTQPTVWKLERSGRVPFIWVERLAVIYDVPLSQFTTLDADTRKDGKYLGLTNEEWSAYHKEYNRLRNREGNPSANFQARQISIYDPRLPARIRAAILGEGYSDDE